MRRPTMTAYKPTVRDMVARKALDLFGDTYANRNLARNFFGSSGLGSTGEMSVADFTPAGVGFAADEAGRQAGQGHPWQAAGNLALAALPVPAVAKGGKGMLGKGLRAAEKTVGYHGSKVPGLSELRTSERGALGPGAYLSPHEGVAGRYGDHVYRAEVSDIFDGMGSRDSSVNPYEVWRNQMARVVEAAPPEMQTAVAELGAKMQPADGYPFFKRLAQLHGSEQAAQDTLRRAGFKGISGHADGPEIAMFDPVPVQPNLFRGSE